MAPSDLNLNSPKLVGFMSSGEVYSGETDLAAYEVPTIEDEHPAIVLVSKSRHDGVPVSAIDPERIEAIAECHDESGEPLLHVEVLDPQAPIPAIARVALSAVEASAPVQAPVLEVETPPQISSELLEAMLNRSLSTMPSVAA